MSLNLTAAHQGAISQAVSGRDTCPLERTEWEIVDFVGQERAPSSVPFLPVYCI